MRRGFVPHFSIWTHLDDLFAPKILPKSFILFRPCWVPIWTSAPLLIFTPHVSNYLLQVNQMFASKPMHLSSLRCLFQRSFLPFEAWGPYQMDTFSALLAFCAENSPVTGEFPSQRPVTRSFDVFFICASTNGCGNNQDAGDLRRHRAHYDANVMGIALHWW